MRNVTKLTLLGYKDYRERGCAEMKKKITRT